MATKVTYNKTTWADGTNGGTPITAARLNNMETGIANTAALANANMSDISTLKDSVSQATTKTSGSLGNGGTYTAKNGVVIVQIVNATLTANQNRAIGTLPVALRPSVSVKGTLHYSQYAGTIDIGTSGAVSITAPFAGDYTGQAVFCI